jgi:outer membrane protein assembly factor BamB
MKRIALAVVFVLLAVLLSAQSPGWPQWRGPNGDGVSRETEWNPSALAGGAKVLWSYNIGNAGFDNVVVLKNRVYAMGPSTKRNYTWTFTCLDAATGEVIWQRDVQSWGRSKGSTPATDGERVYGYTSDGDLCCLQAKDGTIAWKKNVVSDYGIQNGVSNSLNPAPILDGSVVLLNVSIAHIAVDKLTGELRWRHDDPFPAGKTRDGSTANPVVCDVGGKRCALFLGGATASLLEVATGKELWSLALDWDARWVTADPIVSNGKAYIFQGLSTCCYDLSKDSSKPMWKSDAFLNPMATPVLVDGYLYGSAMVDERQDIVSGANLWELNGIPDDFKLPWCFRCVDAATGKIVWEQGLARYVATAAAGGRLLLMEVNTGVLHICNASPDGWSEISSANVLAGVKRLSTGPDSPTFFAIPPVLVAGKLYCRHSVGELICIDASKQ